MPKQKNTTKRRASSRRGKETVTEHEDRTKTLKDWQQTATEILKLRCMANKVPLGGSHNAIAKRLFTKLQENNQPPPTTEGAEQPDNVEDVEEQNAIPSDEDLGDTAEYPLNEDDEREYDEGVNLNEEERAGSEYEESEHGNGEKDGEYDDEEEIYAKKNDFIAEIQSLRSE